MCQIGAASHVSISSAIPIEIDSVVLIVNCLNFVCMLFRHPSPSVLIPALRTVGNIVTGDDMQTQVMNCPQL